METQGREKLRSLIEGIEYAMLTTISPTGEIHSRPMVTQQMDEQGDLWFFTGGTTGKVKELQKDQHVNIAYMDHRNKSYVSVTGMANVENRKEKKEALWNPVLKAWFPDGIKDPDLVLIHVKTLGAEYWESNASTVKTLFGMTKAVLTGEGMDPKSMGENKRLDLNDLKQTA